MHAHYLQRELYEMVQESFEFFDFLQRGSLDGIWYWDLENPEHEWMSPEFWSTLGYDPAEKKHLASEWQDMIFPADLEMAKENLDRHLANPSYPYDQVVRYTHKEGYTCWIRCRGQAIRDPESGRPVRMLGAHTDITSAMKAEAMVAGLQYQISALKMQLQNLQMLVDVRGARIEDLQRELEKTKG